MTILGGVGTLIGPVVGCLLLQWLVTEIGAQQAMDSNFVLGASLIVFVLLVPKGIAPTLRDLALARLARDKPMPADTPTTAKVKT